MKLEFDTDEQHCRFRSENFNLRWADLLDEVYLTLTRDEAMTLPRQPDFYLDAILAIAQQDLQHFGEKLAKGIARTFEEQRVSRFVKHYSRSDRVRVAMLFLDEDGHLVSVNAPVIDRLVELRGRKIRIDDPLIEEQKYFGVHADYSTRIDVLKAYSSYEILTGPLAGRSFTSVSRPLGDPIYHQGVVAGAFRILDASTASNQSELQDVLPKSLSPIEIKAEKFAEKREGRSQQQRPTTHLLSVSEANTPLVTSSEFRKNIEVSFDLAELRTLCLDLNIDHENLRSTTKEEFVTELVKYCQRANKRDLLILLLKDRRPNTNWLA